MTTTTEPKVKTKKIRYGKALVKRFDAILERGLCAGVGDRRGQMCIEAAVCAVLDLPHGDEPECVEPAVRSFKIALNDKKWSSPQARARGLRDVGLAQLGSAGVVDGREFARRLAEKTIRVILPKMLRTLGEAWRDKPWFKKEEFERAAEQCENEGTQAAADAASRAADAASRAADASADAAADAADAASRAADAAADAAYAAARAADAAADAAYAAARAAYAAARAADASAAAAARDEYLVLSANLALEVLRELKSPGVKLLGK